MTRRELLALSAAAAPVDDWQALLARSITHDDDNFAALRSYVFEAYDVSRAPRNQRESQSYEINLVGPGMYFRKMRHNDGALSEEEAKLEQARLRLHLTQPHGSDPNAQWRRERHVLEDWLQSHRFTFKGRRTLDHRSALVVESHPPRDAKPDLAFFTNARCRLTIDEETGHWIEAICDISARTTFTLHQLLLGRLSLPYSPGLVNRADLPANSTFTIRLQRLEDGIWVPRHYRNERVGFLSELTFSKFRKFTSESQLLTDPQ